MIITLKDSIKNEIIEGDVLENLRMPEIEIQNCYSKCMNCFHISSGKKVLIEDCTFESSGVSIAFTGDMNYWFENIGVKDITIQNCKFIECRAPLVTCCEFTPTDKAPFYHENISFINNEIINPESNVAYMQDVNNFVYRNNRVSGLKDGVEEVLLERCCNIKVKSE